MFFPVSKVLWLFADPIAFLTLIVCAGAALLFTRFARAGRALATAGAIGLGLAFLTPLGSALILPLENRFPPPPDDLAPPSGVIVLGGALNPGRAAARGALDINADGGRLIAGLELARRYPKARLVYTGGSGDLFDQEHSEAALAERLWTELGGPVGRMMFETKSRNTWENALFTRTLIGPKPGETWLLVTSAWHMPRSVGVFRQLGFDVVAFPVAYRSFGTATDWSLFQPASVRAGLVAIAVREWIGLLAYRLTGRADALFPAP